MKYYKIDDITNEVLMESDLPLIPLENEIITHKEESSLYGFVKIWVIKKPNVEELQSEENVE